MIGVFRGSRQMDNGFTAKCLDHERHRVLEYPGWLERASSFFLRKMALSGD
jgi:hypothetical protein